MFSRLFSSTSQKVWKRLVSNSSNTNTSSTTTTKCVYIENCWSGFNVCCVILFAKGVGLGENHTGSCRKNDIYDIYDDI